MPRLLVLRGGALGDLIVTLPALAALRRRWPDAHIELVGNARAAVLALDAGWIDRAHRADEPRWSALYQSTPLPPDLAAHLASFEVVLSFWSDPDGDLQRHFPRYPGQRFLAGAPQPTQSPAARHFAAPLATLGIEVPEPWIAVRPRRPGARRLVVHPGSGSPRKNWPLARWAELCRWLRDVRGAELLIVAGEAEPPDALANYGEVFRDMSARALADVLADSRGFLGHDSGVSHLAAACGVPSVLLFGPTEPALWAPPAPHVTVVRRGLTLDAIGLADVQTAALHL